MPSLADIVEVDKRKIGDICKALPKYRNLVKYFYSQINILDINVIVLYYWYITNGLYF